MECVGYDNAFQLELCEKFPLWVPPPRKPRGSGKSSAKQSKVAGRKRKRERSPDSDVDLNPKNEDESELEATGQREEREFDDFSGDEDDAAEVLTYRHGGTRSRPIYI